MIDYITKLELLGDTTVEQGRKHEQLINDLNYLIDEGFVEIEEGPDNVIRLYAT